MEFDGQYLCWMRVGSGVVMLGHANAEVHRIHSPLEAGLTTVMMNVYVHDIDAHYAHAVAGRPSRGTRRADAPRRGRWARLGSVVDRVDDPTVEVARIVEHGNDVAEVLVSRRWIEVSVVAHELLEPVEELEAPSRVCRATHALA